MPIAKSKTMRKTPTEHQQKALEFAIANNGRILLADCPGLGKSLSAIMYLEHQGQWPCLVVCPTSVKGHWKREFEEFTGLKAVVINGTGLCEGQVTEQMVVVNYDILHAQLPWLLEQNFATIVLDEAHVLANRDNKWTKAAMQLAKFTPKVLGLTGTPIANRPADFWPILHVIRPELFPDFSSFAWKYCAPKYEESYGKWSYKGATNLPDLHEKVKPFMLRRGMEVLDLPNQSKSIQFVEMQNREMYDALHKEYVATARSGHWHGRKAKGVDKLTLLSNLLMLVARCKARGVVNWIKNYLAEHPNEKLLAFTTHTAMLDVIARRAVGEGECIVINGPVPAKKRTQLVDAFQNDPSIRLAVLNIKAASAGITLTAATKSVVCELPWTSRDITQLSGRNYRIGQDRETEVIFLLTKGTIEEKLCALIEEKQAYHAKIIEGHSVNELPIHKLLEEEMKK